MLLVKYLLSPEIAEIGKCLKSYFHCNIGEAIFFVYKRDRKHRITKKAIISINKEISSSQSNNAKGFWQQFRWKEVKI